MRQHWGCKRERGTRPISPRRVGQRNSHRRDFLTVQRTSSSLLRLNIFNTVLQISFGFLMFSALFVVSTKVLLLARLLALAGHHRPASYPRRNVHPWRSLRRAMHGTWMIWMARCVKEKEVEMSHREDRVFLPHRRLAPCYCLMMSHVCSLASPSGWFSKDRSNTQLHPRQDRADSSIHSLRILQSTAGCAWKSSSSDRKPARLVQGYLRMASDKST